MTYTYNLGGAMVEQQYPSGRVVKNTLDATGDLSMVTSKENSSAIYKTYVNDFTYNAAGGVTSLKLGNGRFESTQFNSRLQPTQIALGASVGDTSSLKLDYSYGDWVSGSIDATKNNGNIVQQIVTTPTVGSYTGFAATQKYYYDSLNRIDDSTETIGGTQTWRQDFSYDRYGNRNFVEANTSTLPKLCSGSVCAADRKVLNPSAASTNRLVLDQDSDSVNDYAFDSSGNTTRDAQLRKFTYDGENKQTKVETVNSGGTVTGTLGEYVYDGDGKRVKKYVPSTGETTIFVYDAAGKQIAEYSTIVANSTDAKVNYLTNDHLGSPRINTDASGNVLARHDYQPFGEEIFTSQRTTNLGYAEDTVRKQFTGYEHDGETDLDFAENRNYNFSHGRFTTADPLLESGRSNDPQTWNRFVYVLNNPLSYVDPDGLYECTSKSTQECKDFRTHLDDARSKLADIEQKYTKNSDEYVKAKKSLDSYGCESKGGNCIEVDGTPKRTGTDKKGNPIYAQDTASNVHVSFDWKGASPAHTSTDVTSGIVTIQFGSGNDSKLGLIANEGINSADMQSAIATGTSVSLYQSEKDGLFVQAVYGELRASVAGKATSYFGNTDLAEFTYWSQSWESKDHKAVRAGRESAIVNSLKAYYQLSPSDKRPLVTIPKGYKP